MKKRELKFLIAKEVEDMWKKTSPSSCYENSRMEETQFMREEDRLTPEACKQFSDRAEEIGRQTDVYIEKELAAVNGRIDVLERKMMREEHKLRHIKKEHRSLRRENKELRKTIKEQSEAIKKLLVMFNELKRKQKDLKIGVNMLKKIIKYIAVGLGISAPEDTLKVICQEFRSFYKKQFGKKGARERYIDTTYKVLE